MKTANIAKARKDTKYKIDEPRNLSSIAKIIAKMTNVIMIPPDTMRYIEA